MNSIIYQITEEELERIGERIAKDLWDKMSSPSEASTKHYTRKECCEILRCTYPTFHNLVNRGVIPITKLGRKTLIPTAEFDKIVASGELTRYKHHPLKSDGGHTNGR